MALAVNWRPRLILGAAGGCLGLLALQAFLIASPPGLPHPELLTRQGPGAVLVEPGKSALPDPGRQGRPQGVESGVARTVALGGGLPVVASPRCTALPGVPHSWTAASWGWPPGPPGLWAGCRP